MRLAVLGATGKTGILLVEQALAAGHDVAALVRTPSRMSVQHPRLKLVQGDAMEAGKVAQTITGADAVLNALGHVKGSPENLQTVVIGHVIDAMRQQGIRRLVTLTGGGVRHPKDQPKFVDHIFKFLLSMLAGKVLADGERYIEMVRKSGLDYVVVRAPRLYDGPHTGNYKAGYVGKESGTKLSRANLAEFMLQQVTDKRWLCDMPIVTE